MFHSNFHSYFQIAPLASGRSTGIFLFPEIWNLIFSWFSNYQDEILSVDHFLPSSWPVEHFSSSVWLLSFLWPLWFTLAQIFGLAQGVLICGNPFGPSHWPFRIYVLSQGSKKVGFEVGHLSAYVTTNLAHYSQQLSEAHFPTLLELTLNLECFLAGSI